MAMSYKKIVLSILLFELQNWLRILFLITSIDPPRRGSKFGKLEIS